MSKVTVADAAQRLGISKGAIHSRIRRGSLQSVVEDGVKFVIIDSDTGAKPTPKKTTQSYDRYYKLLEEQNSQLQKKVETLESETRALREQKEQMLISEREKIEQIYKDKDEQLKNILNSVSSKFMLNSSQERQSDAIDAEIEQVDSAKMSRLTSLNKHLKTKDLSKKKISKIKERFKERAQTDHRIITIGKKLYIDLHKYDYSDLSL